MAAREGLSALLLCVTALAVGCMDAADRCDPGYELGEYGCIRRVATDGGAGAAADAASDSGAGAAGSADAGEAASSDLGALGRTCTTSDECAGGLADYCAIMPGSPTGVCAVDGCTLEPDDCPAGMWCLDATSLVPTLPTLCIVEGAL